MPKFARFLAAVVLALLLVWQQTAARGTDRLQVHFLNVGQGDAIYARTPAGQDIVIDGGPDNSVLAELGRAMPFWDRTIEIMVLTHPHADHVVGLVELLRRYRVEKIFLAGVRYNVPEYDAFLEEMAAESGEVVVVKTGMEVDLGMDTKLRFLYPDIDLSDDVPENLNNTSLVAKLSYGDSDFLFMGDAETEVEKHLLDQRAELSAAVLKVGHHGSNSSSGEDFLRAVKPQAAVISAGCDNSFGHPHPATLRKLREVGARIYQTCADGTVVMTADKQKVWP